MAKFRDLRKERPCGDSNIVVITKLCGLPDSIGIYFQYDGHLNCRIAKEVGDCGEIYTDDKLKQFRHTEVFWCYESEFFSEVEYERYDS